MVPRTAVFGLAFAVLAAADDRDRVNFEHAPRTWDTAIGFVDDWQKTLVAEDGRLEYDFPGPFNRFKTTIGVGLAGATPSTVAQRLESARIPIVITCKEYGALLLEEEAFAAPPGPPEPLRNDLLCARIRAASGAPEAAFEVLIRSEQPIVAKGHSIDIGGRTFVATTPAFASAASTEQGLRLIFEKKRLAGAEEARLVVSVTRGPGAAPNPRGWEDASAARAAAAALWREAPLPWGCFAVPDPGIQALLDASVRNIYQAREIKKNLPAFQVGPTCYRGLWVVDGAFIMEAIAFLGRVEEARAGIRYLLSFQRDDGAIMIMNRHWKETGIALWAVTRHARLTDDRAWLRSVWPNLMRGFEYIRSMRAETRKKPDAPEAGLIPAGFSDGGLHGVHPEYTNVYWTLVGLKATAEAAAWLGEAEDAGRIRAEFEDFLAVYRKAAARDMQTTPAGSSYVPIRMTNSEKVAPQRAQWAFCHAVFPGRVFAAEDPIVKGNMAAIGADVREGLVYGTGWIADGIWNYFASFWAHANLWLGDGAKAARILYAFANHASPLLCWREEQGLGGKGLVGDMPHNWASAEFIRLVRHILVLERGEELHLFEGLPRAWVRPGARVALKGILTSFGPVDLDLVVPPSGDRADIVLQIHGDRAAPRLVAVHTETWTEAGEARKFDGVKKLATGIALP